MAVEELEAVGGLLVAYLSFSVVADVARYHRLAVTTLALGLAS